MRKQTNILKGERTRRQSGSAMVEICLMAPWIFFLFMGIMDTGFFTYAAISTQNGARAGAVATAQSQSLQVAGTSNDLACVAAWDEMQNLPNVYSATAPTGCSSLPSSMSVVTKTLCGSTTSQIVGCQSNGGTYTCSDCDGTPWDGKTAATPDTKAASSQVAVTYTTVHMVPIPGILPSQITLTRIAEARIIQE